MKVRSMVPTLWDKATDERGPYRQLQCEMDKLFKDYMSDIPLFGRWGNGGLALQVDVAETEKTVEITADLPGVSEKDIDVSLSGSTLTVRAEKKSEKEEKNKDYHLVERSYGTFERSMQLPFKADASQINAKFENGVLKLVIQKPPEAQSKTQKIEVKAAAQSKIVNQ